MAALPDRKDHQTLGRNTLDPSSQLRRLNHRDHSSVITSDNDEMRHEKDGYWYRLLLEDLTNIEEAMLLLDCLIQGVLQRNLLNGFPVLSSKNWKNMRIQQLTDNSSVFTMEWEWKTDVNSKQIEPSSNEPLSKLTIIL